MRGKWTSDLLSYAANGTISLGLLPDNPVFMEDRCAGACCLLSDRVLQARLTSE
jgi:hypothetical protein